MTTDLNNSIELMAPAGNFTGLEAALQGGADAVYFGVEHLNMRAKSTNNFKLRDLPEIRSRCDAYGARCYLTLNTILYDHDLPIMRRLMDEAKASGMDAVILSDQAAIQYAHQIDLPVHLSTQLNISNIETVKFYANFADVMVLARELSLKQVKNITDQIAEQQITGPGGELIGIEVFSHGALCMAVSGKCYMSLHQYNASANRGACLQPCRRSYTLSETDSGKQIEVDNEYLMSPKDLCTIDFLDEVLASGVSVLKIEGRARSPEYIKTVTQCYKEAIEAYNRGEYSDDKIEDWKGRLKLVYNRGFWAGYYRGRKLGEWSRQYGSQATRRKLYVGRYRNFYKNINVAEFEVVSYPLEQGDKVLIVGPNTGVVETEIKELRVNGEPASEAHKGDLVTFAVPQHIRSADELYKWEPKPEKVPQS